MATGRRFRFCEIQTRGKTDRGVSHSLSSRLPRLPRRLQCQECTPRCAAPLLAIIGKYTNQPPDVVAKTLAYVDPEGRLDVANVARQVAWYQSQGFVDKGFGVDQVVDRRFVTER